MLRLSHDVKDTLTVPDKFFNNAALRQQLDIVRSGHFNSQRETSPTSNNLRLRGSPFLREEYILMVNKYSESIFLQGRKYLGSAYLRSYQHDRLHIVSLPCKDILDKLPMINISSVELFVFDDMHMPVPQVHDTRYYRLVQSACIKDIKPIRSTKIN